MRARLEPSAERTSTGEKSFPGETWAWQHMSRIAGQIGMAKAVLGAIGVGSGRSMELADLLARLERDGILLLSDASLPSVVSMVAGGPVRGSWWSHPQGKRIFALTQALG